MGRRVEDTKMGRGGRATMEAGRRCSILMMMTVSCEEDTCVHCSEFGLCVYVSLLDCTIK